jgi:hypothetical protein
MKNTPFSLKKNDRWTVIAQDQKNWRVGVYHPEFTSSEQITKLEKHSCPELFICVNAPCGILLIVDGKEIQYIINPNEAILVTEYHNGFKVDPEGYFIVVEQTEFTTECIERKTI